MSGYNRNKKTYGLTMTKMEWWHRNNPHANISREHCQVCNAKSGDLGRLAAYFRSNGFIISKVGNAFIDFTAISPAYIGPGGITTQEVDALYHFLAGTA